MFRETLLESASGARRRKRWPMLLAVALEVTVCSVLIAVPLSSTVIIPAAARPVDRPIYEPMPMVHSRPANNSGGSGPGSPVRHAPVVPIIDGKSHITFGPPTPPDNPALPLSPTNSGPSGPALPPCIACGSGARPGGPGYNGPQNVSHGVLEGYLIHRVDPIYPHIATIIGTSGQVRLHAIISKDGTIESLTLISGHPLLARAAMEAVQQWRYRPYLLNHEPVEVETFITVNFNNAR